MLTKVVIIDQGEVFKDPFRFLPYCPQCNAEISSDESPCHKCGVEIEWPKSEEKEKMSEENKEYSNPFEMQCNNPKSFAIVGNPLIRLIGSEIEYDFGTLEGPELNELDKCMMIISMIEFLTKQLREVL